MLRFIVFVTIYCPSAVMLSGYLIGYIFISEEVLLIFNDL